MANKPQPASRRPFVILNYFIEANAFKLIVINLVHLDGWRILPFVIYKNVKNHCICLEKS